MSGRMIHVPHRHTRPPMFSDVFNPPGSVWACDCGHVWTLVNTINGKTWREGRGPWPSPYTDDLEGALRFIRDQANQHRKELGLRLVAPVSTEDRRTARHRV